jgi:Cupin
LPSEPGGLRELIWHAIAAEWAYVVEGNVRATVMSPNGEAEQTDFGPGDVWFFPKGHGHSLQGLGPGEAHFILGFDDGHFSDLELFPSLTGSVTLRRIRLDASPAIEFPGGELRIVSQKEFPIQNSLTGATMLLKQGRILMLRLY